MTNIITPSASTKKKTQRLLNETYTILYRLCDRMGLKTCRSSWSFYGKKSNMTFVYGFKDEAAIFAFEHDWVGMGGTYFPRRQNHKTGKYSGFCESDIYKSNVDAGGQEDLFQIDNIKKAGYKITNANPVRFDLDGYTYFICLKVSESNGEKDYLAGGNYFNRDVGGIIGLREWYSKYQNKKLGIMKVFQVLLVKVPDDRDRPKRLIGPKMEIGFTVLAKNSDAAYELIKDKYERSEVFISEEDPEKPKILNTFYTNYIMKIYYIKVKVLPEYCPMLDNKVERGFRVVAKDMDTAYDLVKDEYKRNEVEIREDTSYQDKILGRDYKYYG